MGVKRRQILRGAAAMAAATTAAAASAASRPATGDSAGHATSTSVGAAGVVSANMSAGMSEPRAIPPMNMSRAAQVMEEDGIDALVLAEGTNFYHASGHRPVTTRMGHRPSNVAIVTRSESQRLTFVLSSFSYYYTMADSLDADNYPIYLYTAPEEENASEARPVRVFPDRQEAPMDDIESRRASLTFLAEEERHASPGLGPALARALTELGLARGKIALDHQSILARLEGRLPNASFVGASNALSRIRPIKSDTEIALMRRAATMNAEAALAAVSTVRAGASYRDLRNVFAAEAALRGNRSVFMVVDRVSSDHFDAPFRDGQSFLIDAVSEYQGYHGDYGRTVFIGEPPEPMAKATQKIGRAWDELRGAIRPGMRFSEVSALGVQTLKKLGGNYPVSFTPHSVGLYHTDHVDPVGAGSGWQDLVLEPGMIISVDCPLLAAGVGGSAHLEDLMLITATGSEPINAVGDQVILL
jgi:Xaa-Pro aminopeptidase